MKRNILRIGDISIFLVFIATIIFSSILLLGSTSTIKVKAADDEYLFSSNEQGIYKVEGELGTTVIEIKDNKIRFLDSPCPHKSCISEDFASTVVCLPNKVIATCEHKDDHIDAIAR